MPLVDFFLDCDGGDFLDEFRIWHSAGFGAGDDSLANIVAVEAVFEGDGSESLLEFEVEVALLAVVGVEVLGDLASGVDALVILLLVLVPLATWIDVHGVVDWEWKIGMIPEEGEEGSGVPKELLP